MFPPNGYPTWRDALRRGYKLKPEKIGEFLDSIENIEEMITEMHRDRQEK